MSRTFARKRAGAEIFFAVTLFLSAALLFAVQPMFAKMVLPLLGGAGGLEYVPGVLSGHAAGRIPLRPLIAYLAGHAAAGGLAFGAPWPAMARPADRRGRKLAAAGPCLSGPLVVDAAVGFRGCAVFGGFGHAPMLQAWFSQTGSRSSRDPYFLYAASNLGSLLALLSYPLLIESHWTLGEQTWGWTAGYGLLMLLIAGCAVQLWRSSPGAQSPSAAKIARHSRGRVDYRTQEPIETRPTLRRRLHWLVLSLVPSSLLLGVTTYISTDVAAIPLLWVLPLALYLLSLCVRLRPATNPAPSLDAAGTALLDRDGGRIAGLAGQCADATFVGWIATTSGVFRHGHGMPRPACRRPTG